MIYIPKKNNNEINYKEEFAKKLNYVIIVNDKQSSNTGDLFSIWNQKTNVFISSEIGDLFDFLNDDKLGAKSKVLIIGAKNTSYEEIEEYRNLLSFYLFYKTELIKFEKHMVKINKDLLNKKDNSVIRDLSLKFSKLNKDGKYIRALLISLAYRVASGKEDNYYLNLAAAYETFQSSILIHDDIIDEAEKRRGKPTVQKQYYEKFNDTEHKDKNFNKKLDHFSKSMALCAGDLGLYFANKIMLENYENEFHRLFKYYNQIVINTIKGEILDVYLPFASEYSKHVSSEKDVLDIYRLKTAWYSIIGPFALGLILGGATDNNVRRMEEILESLGIAFQIKDDILGIYGDKIKMGKSTNSDISEAKQTILYVYANNKDYKARLDLIYGKKNLSKGDIEEVKKIFKESSALKSAENLLEEKLNEAKYKIQKSRYIKKAEKEILLGFITYLNLREK